jgi:hypothetical protein
MKRMLLFLTVVVIGALFGGVAAASPGNRPMPPIITRAPWAN